MLTAAATQRAYLLSERTSSASAVPVPSIAATSGAESAETSAKGPRQVKVAPTSAVTSNRTDSPVAAAPSATWTATST